MAKRLWAAKREIRVESTSVRFIRIGAELISSYDVVTLVQSETEANW